MKVITSINPVRRSQTDRTQAAAGNPVDAIMTKKRRRGRTRRWRQLIRVVYPTDGSRIALRTEENWDSNVEADCVGEDGCISEFQIETQRPYFYFKPVLLRDGATMWSRKDFLAVATSGAALEIYPYFREDMRFSVSELMEPLASRSGAQNRFRVFLPPSYDENTLKKYPVLYMHDGHNLFFKEEAFVGKTWKTDAVLQMLDNMNATEGVIVVGIYPNDRMTEYTLPGYENYGRFLVEMLKPVIDTNYRTLAGPESTAVMGSSLGGVVSFYLGWQWPQVFGKVACLSSTFTQKDDLLERISAEPKRPIRIYLDSGWPGDNYEATRSMRDRLIWKGYRPGSELLYLAFPEAKHDENAWAARSPIPFQFLFGKLPVFSRRSHPRDRFTFPDVPNPKRGL
jgi:predicted alpha/beta superfamily hydrolase